MNRRSLGMMPIVCMLLLAGCGDSASEPPPLPAATAGYTAVPQSTSAPAPQPGAAEDETVVEVEPEVDLAEPMDGAAPMVDAAPMSENPTIDQDEVP